MQPSQKEKKGYQELKQKRKDKHAGNTCRVPPPANDTSTTGVRHRAAEETARSRRNPAEASPRPTSPWTQCRPPKVLVEETTCSWMYAPGRSNTKKEGDLRGEELKQKKRINMLGIRTESPPPANDITGGAPPGRQRSGAIPAQSRRDPSEASPGPTSPRTQRRLPKVLGENHRPLVDVRPRPVKHQKSRRPAREGIGLQTRQNK